MQMTSGWLAADVWSLGCSLVEMLSAEIPYAYYSNSMTAMYRIVSGEVPRVNAEVSKEMQEVISKCCTEQAEARPAVEALLALPLVAQALAVPSRLFCEEVVAVKDKEVVEKEEMSGDYAEVPLSPASDRAAPSPLPPSSDAGSNHATTTSSANVSTLGELEEIIPEEQELESSLTPALFPVPRLAPSFSQHLVLSGQASAFALSREGTAPVHGAANDALKSGLDDYESDFEDDPSQVNEESARSARGVQASTVLISLPSQRPRAPLTGELRSLHEPAVSKSLPNSFLWQQPADITSGANAAKTSKETLPPVKESLIKQPKPARRLGHREDHGASGTVTGSKTLKAPQSLKSSVALAKQTRNLSRRDQELSALSSIVPSSSASISNTSNSMQRAISNNSRHLVPVMSKSIRSFSAGVYGVRTTTSGTNSGTSSSTSKVHRLKPNLNTKLPALQLVHPPEHRYVQSAPAVSRSINLPPIRKPS
jgi:hypothetical protein